MRDSHSSLLIDLPFLPRGVLCGLLAIASLLPVGGCGGNAQDSGDGDGDGDGVGDGDGDGLPASLDTDDLLVSLDTAEIEVICDIVADFHGGYGVTVECGDGISATSSPSRAACVADSVDLPSTCAATVGDVLSCGESLSETCVFTDAGCLALFSCVN